MTTSAEVLPWVAIAIQGGLGLYVLGKAKGLLDAVTNQVSDLKAKQTADDGQAFESTADRAKLNARVAALENNATTAEHQRDGINANVQKTREELAAFRATAEEQHRNSKDDAETMKRGLNEVNRRLGELAKERLGYRVPSPPEDPHIEARRSAPR